MFKRFTVEESVSSNSKVKSSVQRGIRSKIVEQYPMIEDIADELLPKKEPMFLVKCQDHIQLVVMNGEPLFFNHRDERYFPTLRLLHKYPGMLPRVRTDRGAIRFVLSGAHIMCPGLTHENARMQEGLEVGDYVAIMAEGKEHAMGLGVMKMTTDEIREVNKGHGVENVHYLNDGLWNTRSL